MLHICMYVLGVLDLYTSNINHTRLKYHILQNLSLRRFEAVESVTAHRHTQEQLYLT